MSLSSLQLDAFMEVARAKSFSAAAQRLHLTQSALSQRVINLEQELSSSLFVRESSGVRFTELGEKLLRYCQAKESLELEFLSGLRSGDQQELAGFLRIGSFSTLSRSRLLPRLGAFARKHPKVQVEVLTRELAELPELLKSSRVDFIFCTHPIEKQEYENLRVGSESNVLVESVKGCRENVYLDHDEADTTTADFWKLQKSKPKPYTRAYFDEIYAIIDAAEEGLGRAVVPRHLVEGNKKFRILKAFKPLEVDIYLIYFKQAFYSRLQSQWIQSQPAI